MNNNNIGLQAMNKSIQSKKYLKFSSRLLKNISCSLLVVILCGGNILGVDEKKEYQQNNTQKQVWQSDDNAAKSTQNLCSNCGAQINQRVNGSIRNNAAQSNEAIVENLTKQAYDIVEGGQDLDGLNEVLDNLQNIDIKLFNEKAIENLAAVLWIFSSGQSNMDQQLLYRILKILKGVDYSKFNNNSTSSLILVLRTIIDNKELRHKGTLLEEALNIIKNIENINTLTNEDVERISDVFSKIYETDIAQHKKLDLSKTIVDILYKNRDKFDSIGIGCIAEMLDRIANYEIYFEHKSTTLRKILYILKHNINKISDHATPVSSLFKALNGIVKFKASLGCILPKYDQAFLSARILSILKNVNKLSDNDIESFTGTLTQMLMSKNERLFKDELLNTLCDILAKIKDETSISRKAIDNLIESLDLLTSDNYTIYKIKNREFLSYAIIDILEKNRYKLNVCDAERFGKALHCLSYGITYKQQLSTFEKTISILESIWYDAASSLGLYLFDKRVVTGFAHALYFIVETDITEDKKVSLSTRILDQMDHARDELRGIDVHYLIEALHKMHRFSIADGIKKPLLDKILYRVRDNIKKLRNVGGVLLGRTLRHVLETNIDISEKESWSKQIIDIFEETRDKLDDKAISMLQYVLNNINSFNISSGCRQNLKQRISSLIAGHQKTANTSGHSQQTAIDTSGQQNVGGTQDQSQQNI